MIPPETSYFGAYSGHYIKNHKMNYFLYFLMENIYQARSEIFFSQPLDTLKHCRGIHPGKLSFSMANIFHGLFQTYFSRLIS